MTINYAYDNLERLSSRQYLGGRVKLGTDTFTYHDNGLLKKAVGGLYNTTVDRSNLQTDYDGANRLLQEQQKIGAGPKTIAYRYDPDGFSNEITYPGGNRMQQAYTDRRELFQVKLDDQVLASHAYDAAGRRTGRTYANGLTTQWGYDADNRNTRLNHVNVQAWDYRYTGEGDTLVQDDLTTADRGEAYAYDGMHRLIDNKRGQVAGNTVSAPTFLQSWTLDKIGNWTTWNDNGANETRTHNNHHALTSRGNVPLPQLYDANFNQTDDGNSPFTLVYDANDRLQQVKDRSSGAVLVRYNYDAFGRRVEKSIAGLPNPQRITRYYYSDQRIIEERDRRDEVQAVYTYGTYIDEPLTMDRDGERFYYHGNRVFSTYALTDSAGQIVERYSYTPYGEATTFDAAYQNAGFVSRVGNPFTFTSRELDAETGLMHFRTRTYDPLQGRFKQRDPAGYVDGMNLYAGYFSPNSLDPYGFEDEPTPEPVPPPPPLPPSPPEPDPFNLELSLSGGIFQATVSHSESVGSYGHITGSLTVATVPISNGVNIAGGIDLNGTGGFLHEPEDLALSAKVIYVLKKNHWTVTAEAMGQSQVFSGYRSVSGTVSASYLLDISPIAEYIPLIPNSVPLTVNLSVDAHTSKCRDDEGKGEFSLSVPFFTKKW